MLKIVKCSNDRDWVVSKVSEKPNHYEILLINLNDVAGSSNKAITFYVVRKSDNKAYSIFNNKEGIGKTYLVSKDMFETMDLFLYTLQCGLEKF